MSKQTFKPNQVVYTYGYPELQDGTKLTVSPTHQGGVIISCVDELKKYFFVDIGFLSTEKLVVIPSWLKSLGATPLTSNRMVYIFGDAELPNQAIAYVADNYTHNYLDKEVRCVVKSKTPWQYYMVDKSNIYLHTTPYQTPVVVKPLASAFTEFSDDHKYMIELLKEPTRAKVIELTLRGVDLELYDTIVGPKYFVMVPKTPTKFMPMIMAHTDIQRNVQHPNDNLEYDPKLDKFSSPRGLGADDRAGCYAINKIMNNHPGKFIIALFDEEEIGCIGSGDFLKDKQFAEVDKLVSCYISIDRKRGHTGVGQIATYGYDNNKLFDLVKQATGRATVLGSSTDCRTLSSGSKALPKNKGVACFNMSCGYENEHTSAEALYFGELQTVVSDFECMELAMPELWTERFEAITVKPIKTQTAYTYTWPEEEIEVDGDYYDASDVKTLLWYYQQTTGKEYDFNVATKQCKDFAVNNYVRFDSSCIVNGIYGGFKLTKDLSNVLSNYTWVIVKIKGMSCELQSECLTQTATNVPFAWLNLVTISDPLTQTN